MNNKIILEILELCQDESYKNNFLNNINTPDAFTRGLLAGHKEIAIKILDIINEGNKNLHGVKNVMYNRHKLKLVVPNENPDRIKEPKMWKHYCEEEETEIEVSEGEACNWCEEEEED